MGRSPKGNQPNYYQSLLTGKFPLSPRFAKGSKRLGKFNPLQEYRRLRSSIKRQYNGKLNVLLAKKLGPQQQERKSNWRANKSSHVFSRQSSVEDYGAYSLNHSLENIFSQVKGGREHRKTKFALTPTTLQRMSPIKAMMKQLPNMTKSLFGGSCGNIYEKSKSRRNSGFDHPQSLYSSTYSNTIIGLESIRPKMTVGSGYKSPKAFLGIGEFEVPGEDLQPIMDDDGFSDVGFDGTCEEDGDSEEECTMDFDTESMSSQSSAEVSGVNEYRYRTSRPLTQNPLYISDSCSSSCSSVEARKYQNRSKKTKKGYPKPLPLPFRTDWPSSRRSSGTDMELLLNQRQRQAQSSSFVRVLNLPPKWTTSQNTKQGTSRDGKTRGGGGKKSRRRDKFDVYETLNEELIFYKNDRSRSQVRSKASSTVPHSRTGSPCSVNSLHLTTRSNTPTQFQMHFHPIHPVIGGGATRKPLQKINPFAVSPMVRSGVGGGQRGGGQAPSVVVGGSSNANSNMPEQKLSVRTPMKLFLNFLLIGPQSYTLYMQPPTQKHCGHFVLRLIGHTTEPLSWTLTVNGGWWTRGASGALIGPIPTTAMPTGQHIVCCERAYC